MSLSFFVLLLHAVVGLLGSLHACKRSSFILTVSGASWLCVQACWMLGIGIRTGLVPKTIYAGFSEIRPKLQAKWEVRTLAHNGREAQLMPDMAACRASKKRRSEWPGPMLVQARVCSTLGQSRGQRPPAACRCSMPRKPVGICDPPTQTSRAHRCVHA